MGFYLTTGFGDPLPEELLRGFGQQGYAAICQHILAADRA